MGNVYHVVREEVGKEGIAHVPTDCLERGDAR